MAEWPNWPSRRVGQVAVLGRLAALAGICHLRVVQPLTDDQLDQIVSAAELERRYDNPLHRRAVVLKVLLAYVQLFPARWDQPQSSPQPK